MDDPLLKTRSSKIFARKKLEQPSIWTNFSYSQLSNKQAGWNKHAGRGKS